MQTENEIPAPTLAEEMTTLAADIVTLEGDAQELSDSLNQIRAQIDEKKDKVRALLGIPRQGVKAGDLTIDWKGPNRKFDEDSFQVKYPAKTNAHMYKTVPARTVIAKEMIPPALKEQFMVPGTGEGTVTVR